MLEIINLNDLILETIKNRLYYHKTLIYLAEAGNWEE